ncbi:hypothetical protein T310_8791, partial [Rasamsonia emersonii CBS 393.64]
AQGTGAVEASGERAENSRSESQAKFTLRTNGSLGRMAPELLLFFANALQSPGWAGRASNCWELEQNRRNSMPRETQVHLVASANVTREPTMASSSLTQTRPEAVGISGQGKAVIA